MSNTNSQSVQSVERALTLLQIIAGEDLPISIHSLTERTNLNRTTVWRLLTTLEDMEFIERDPISKGYRVGHTTAKICPDIQSQNAWLIRIAKPFMKDYSEVLREDVLLTIPRYNGMLTIYQERVDNAIQVRDYTMQISSFHSSSNGKLYLSYLEEAELNRILEQELLPETQFTITDPSVLRQQIILSRRQGFGVSLEENGIGENGLSVPIMEKNNPIAFMNISGPSFRFTEERLYSIAAETIRVANRISEYVSGVSGDGSIRHANK